MPECGQCCRECLALATIQAQSPGLVRFCSGPANNSREADLLRMVERVIRQIAADSISANRQLGLVALWKGHTVPTSGLCPHEGRFYPNAFRNIY